jgi:Arc/MetJ family transcription regulator
MIDNVLNVRKANLSQLLVVVRVRPVPFATILMLERSELLALLQLTDSALIAQATFICSVMVQAAAVCLVAPNAVRVRFRRTHVAETSHVVASSVHQALTKFAQKEA